MKKIFITGCCGFIGRHLTKRLIDEGYEVVGIDNYSTCDTTTFDHGMLKHFHFEFHYLESMKKSTYARLLHGCDVIIHLAAKARVQPSFTDVVEYHKTNLTGLMLLLEAAKDAKIKDFIFASSSSVYGELEVEMAISEDMNLNPQSPYALHKKMGEDYINFYADMCGFDAKILRFFNVYGEGMATNPKYIQALQKFFLDWMDGKPLTIYGSGNQERDFTYVGDVVDAIIRTIDHEGSETFNIGAGVAYPIIDVARMVVGDEYPIDFLEARDEPSFTLADNRKAKKLLGWNPQTTLSQWISKRKNLLQSCL